MLACLVLLAACGSAGAGPAASCVGPRLVALSPESGPAGTPVTVTVEWLREGCNDHGGPDEERPLHDVPVWFEQQADTTVVGTVTGSGDRYTGTLRFAVPATARTGPAVLSLGAGHQTLGTFVVG